ncbi:MAG: glutathione S-transferase [Woeseiaceae bacterium]|jgi:glutathione S-transferase
MIELIGYMDSPFVRRVGVSAKFLGVPFEHKELSIFRNYDEFRKINPLVKVPTLICEDGQLLVESTLIIDHLETISGKTLMPDDSNDRIAALGFIGTALVAMEKVAQLIYETKLRPEELQQMRWIERLEQQLTAATIVMEQSVGDGSSWFFGDDISQADISVAIAWRFVQHVVPQMVLAEKFPGLVEFSTRAEVVPEFAACPLS